jgi:hypothetical protein
LGQDKRSSGAAQKHARELIELADAVHCHVERIEREAHAVAEAAAGPDRVPAARHFVAVVDGSAGHEAAMAQLIEAVDVAIGLMDAARVFLASIEVEDDA